MIIILYTPSPMDDSTIRERRRELEIKQDEIRKELSSLPQTSLQWKGLWLALFTMASVFFIVFFLSEYNQCQWFNMAAAPPVIPTCQFLERLTMGLVCLTPVILLLSVA